MSMTIDEQRIAVAEWAGYQWSKPAFRHDGKWWCSFMKGTPFDFDSSWAGNPPPFGQCEKDLTMLPDYVNDLNAMWEPWENLNVYKREKAYSILFGIVGRDTTNRVVYAYDVVNAKSNQRLEALCRTLWPERWEK